jgi:hypothetical protein
MCPRWKLLPPALRHETIPMSPDSELMQRGQRVQDDGCGRLTKLSRFLRF